MKNSDPDNHDSAHEIIADSVGNKGSEGAVLLSEHTISLSFLFPSTG
jgi:hypothetical protein